MKKLHDVARIDALVWKVGTTLGDGMTRSYESFRGARL